ncbi:MAG: RluA family pseudouridine synthase [Eubacteriales bacterium]|nr:RluA family pseudouridine synthase [Eubacteriales bacterium]
MQNFIIKNIEDTNIRIDTLLTKYFENKSRNYFNKLFQLSNIKVNGKIIKASYKTKLNDEIEIILPPDKTLDIKEEKINLEIIFEDKYLLIINKPKGMVVHPANGNTSGTLVNALLYHCKDSLSSINGVIRPGIVHRIDKDTSGLLVVAKDDYTHNNLSLQFKNHTNLRKYIAIVRGAIKEDSGTIDKLLARSKKDRKKIAISIDGKKAITHYKVLQRFNNFTFIECKLETGRTHQIRVHMASINHPLLGDPLYGSNEDKKKGKGQYLCATTLGFIHPFTKKYVEFNIKTPDYFEEELRKLSLK